MKDVCKIPELGIGKNNVIKRQDVQLIRTQFDKCYIVFWIAEKGSKRKEFLKPFVSNDDMLRMVKLCEVSISKHKKI